ncbi:spore germination protein [Halonatronum saccharophilum]|uniref:spore germination protein n=1 Tax=Halonatronum saccharophilum TaxID=150060 RepID=UPI0004BC0C2E|nr:spore germination protein [Halonatronum saccharophilum]
MGKDIKRPVPLEEKTKEGLNKLEEKYKKGKNINNKTLDSNLDKNLAYIEGIFNKVSDFAVKEFIIKGDRPIKAGLIYIGGIVEETIVNDVILKQLMVTSRDRSIDNDISNTGYLDKVEGILLNVSGVQREHRWAELIDYILCGHAILLVDGERDSLVLDIHTREKRSVADPETETVVRGPREGFIEDYNTNLALIRTKIKTPDLKYESFKLGRVSKTHVTIAYIEGIADDKLVEETTKRLESIDIDIINESGIIEQLIEDNPFSPFPQMLNTERPDGVAAALNEGRIAVITDGTPFVLTFPAVFFHFLQANEDYYERGLFPTAVRLLRYMAFLIALLGPATYISITTFHQEMIPSALLISIAASRSGVPFPAIIEALIMEVAFELLREAGLRLPKPVGQAISIVGALIVGEAAVQAGLVSQAMVIVVALTGIASFIIPSHSMGTGVRLLRFPLMLLAAGWGMFGITFGMMLLLIHLSSLRSFGVPYLSPVSPTHPIGFKDVLFKAPEWFKNRRPDFIVKRDKQRIKDNAMPRPPKEEEDES